MITERSSDTHFLTANNTQPLETLRDVTRMCVICIHSVLSVRISCGTQNYSHLCICFKFMHSSEQLAVFVA
jgi:hypothetical protein